MREIKFRQPIYKDGKFEQFHLWGYGIEIDNISIPEFVEPHTSGGKFRELKPSEQYLGRTDKNGIEVYEGDFLKTDFGYGEDLGKEGVTFAGFFYADGECCVSESIEVTGNIHENPELIKE